MTYWRAPHTRSAAISRDAMFFICGGLIGVMIGFATGMGWS